MASNPPGACCIQGFKHKGTPSGETKQIGDINTYFAYPNDSNQKTDTAILFITDLFGVHHNAKLLADDFASSGYLTVMPDLFQGDQVGLNEIGTAAFDLFEWLGRHGAEKVDPVIEAAVKYIRENLGIKRIGAVGYCFGGKYVCRFLKDGKIDVGYTAHPSFVSREELGGVAGPLAISAAETDTIFTTKLRHESEEILAKTNQPWQIHLFSGVQHGFAVRGDLSDPKVKFAKEQAFVQAVTWFNHHLETDGSTKESNL
ncbi:hypothetical protein FQN57_001952 [Myotisia sp. PD_48]|nr:hypothetical protein FQN57_001952 [Myotisia sp. PD_48]